MKKAAFMTIVALSIVAAMCLSSGAGAAEFRALWIDGWHSGMWTQAEIDAMMDGYTDGLGYHKGVRAGNYNVIIPQIRKKADALHISTYGGPDGTGEPMYPGVPAGFDPLAYMIEKAHGYGMQVHVWVCTHRCPTTTSDWMYVTAPYNTWFTKNYAGAEINSEGYWVDPGIPDGEEYTVNVMLDIVKNYDIDGIQWDRVRYPTTDSGYNDIALARYLVEYPGARPGISDGTWSTWRRRQLNDFVARAYAQIMEIKPSVKVGANTFATYSDAYGARFQDWDAWMSNKWLDINAPMNYTTDINLFDTRLLDALNKRYGRYVYDGHNIGSNTHSNSATQIAHCRSYDTPKGNPWGEQGYSYYHSTTTMPGWFEYVSASSSRPFYSATTIPAVTWKDTPTAGIILGRVTDASHPGNPVYHDWIYNATVTLTATGVNRSTKTDGTGYFVFTEVAPKLPGSCYTITVSKSGFASQTYSDQAIAAGQVLRADFDLGATTTKTLASPTGAVNTGWALFSLPLAPVDPNPPTVLPGIRLDGNLYRWERGTQSQFMYDEWKPEEFGNLMIDQGYWLIAESPYTISYSAYRDTPARNSSLPTAGWNMVGCPFEREVEWQDIMVVNGSQMVPIRNAVKDVDKQWLNGTAYWWESSNQSQYDLGLEEDWPSTTHMKPWHGYWVQSYVNNLTLQLRLSPPE
jgi:uncharacterized lipoprotein YddW (UPF0748 family)